MKIFCHNRQSHHLVISFFFSSLDRPTPRKSFSTESITCRWICWHRKLVRFDIINHLSNVFFSNGNWNVSLAGSAHDPWWNGYVPHTTHKMCTTTAEREREMRMSEFFVNRCEDFHFEKSPHWHRQKNPLVLFLSGLTHPRIQLSIPIISSLSVSILCVRVEISSK